MRLLLSQLRHSQDDGPQPSSPTSRRSTPRCARPGVDLRVDVDPAPSVEPPAAAQLAVYRILQEALTNALRHGDGPVEVQLAWHPDRVDLAVRNCSSTAGARPEVATRGRASRGDRPSATSRVTG